MKKRITIALLLALACGALAQDKVELPTETIAMPLVSGEATIRVWNQDAQDWMNPEEYKASEDVIDDYGVVYTGSVSFDFEVPEWGDADAEVDELRWFWVGVWDYSVGDYVFGRWISHQRTFPEEE